MPTVCLRDYMILLILILHRLNGLVFCTSACVLTCKFCLNVPSWYKLFELLGGCVVYVVILFASFRKCFSIGGGYAEFSIEISNCLMFALFIW